MFYEWKYFFSRTSISEMSPLASKTARGFVRPTRRISRWRTSRWPARLGKRACSRTLTHVQRNLSSSGCCMIVVHSSVEHFLWRPRPPPRRSLRMYRDSIFYDRLLYFCGAVLLYRWSLLCVCVLVFVCPAMGWASCCCCLHIKSRSDLYSVLSNIRTGPTDANAFRGHRLTTQKGYTYQKEIKDPEKSTHTR